MIELTPEENSIRDQAILKMEERKVQKTVLSKVKENNQKEKGVAGSKGISTGFKIPEKAIIAKADPNKKDGTSFYINETGLVMCDYAKHQNQIALEEIEEIIKERKREGYPERSVTDIRFDLCGFTQDKKDRKFIQEQVQKYCDLDSLVTSFRTRWFYFWGNVGRGKTAQAIRIVWETIKDDPRFKASFITVGDWVRSQMPEEENMGFGTQDIVILDEFDNFDITKEFQCTAVSRLIDNLKNRGCKVIITSNRSLEEIKSKCHPMLYRAISRIEGKSIMPDGFLGKSLR